MKSENSPALLKEASWRLITARSPFLQINETPAGSMSLANEPWTASSGKLTGLESPPRFPSVVTITMRVEEQLEFICRAQQRVKPLFLLLLRCLCSGWFPAPASLGSLAGKFPRSDSAGTHLVGLSFLAAKSSMKDGQPEIKNRPSSGFDKHAGSGKRPTSLG